MLESANIFNEHRLLTCLSRLGVDSPGEIFDKLSAAYREPGRHYHDETHINECLLALSTFDELAEHSAEVETAIWFHDAVYDTRATDNEEQSAKWAHDYLTATGASSCSVSRIVSMILATKSHISQSPDESLLLDIDLAILGTAPDQFERYDVAIRKEYEWVAFPEYVAGRTKVLQSFLDRAAIYQTPPFVKAYESLARANLTKKIAELAAERVS